MRRSTSNVPLASTTQCYACSYDRVIWVSGTPINSSLRDLVSPLTLFWRTYDISWKDVDTWHMGNLEGLYDEHYDPYEEVNGAGDDPRAHTKGLFHPSIHVAGKSGYEGVERMRQMFDKDKFPIWVFSPYLFKKVGDSQNWSTDFGRTVVDRIFQVSQIRRTMRTKCTLDDGTIVYPSTGLKPATIVVEECEYKPGSAVLGIFQEWFSVQANKLFTPESEALVPDLRNDQNRGLDNQSEARLNFGVHREGVLMSHDPRYLQLLRPGTTAPLRGSKNSQIAALRDTSTTGRSMTAKAAKRKVALKIKAGEGPIISTEHTKVIVDGDVTGGLAYVFAETRVDPDLPISETRSGWGQYIPVKSSAELKAIDQEDTSSSITMLPYRANDFTLEY